MFLPLYMSLYSSKYVPTVIYETVLQFTAGIYRSPESRPVNGGHSSILSLVDRGKVFFNSLNMADRGKMFFNSLNMDGGQGKGVL